MELRDSTRMGTPLDLFLGIRGQKSLLDELQPEQFAISSRFMNDRPVVFELLPQAILVQDVFSADEDGEFEQAVAGSVPTPERFEVDTFDFHARCRRPFVLQVPSGNTEWKCPTCIVEDPAERIVEPRGWGVFRCIAHAQHALDHEKSVIDNVKDGSRSTV